jgi:hypothetical protein
MHQTCRRTRLLLLLCAIALLTGCVTPVAVRGLSAQLVRTQLAYSLSLRGYFAAVEKFADAQVKIADYRIDEITSQMNREFGRRASTGLDLARTPEERRRIIDQLVKDVAGNTSADLPLKRKITDAVATLKQRDQELESAYLVILAASQKLDEYIRLKKADEVAIQELTRAVGVSSEQITSIVDEIAKVSQDLTLTQVRHEKG